MKLKLKPQFKKFLIAACLGILALNIAVGIKYITNQQPVEAYKYIEKHEALESSEYTISEEMVMSKLKARSQIVSLEQSIAKKDVNVDKGLLGERHTELTLKGKYKIGLETKNIKVRDIDSDNGAIYVQLPDPTLISLDIPLDQVSFDKTSGWLRMALDENEEKKFFKAAKKNVELELMKDEEVISQANLNNQRVVEEILRLIPQIKTVVFE